MPPRMAVRAEASVLPAPAWVVWAAAQGRAARGRLARAEPGPLVPPVSALEAATVLLAPCKLEERQAPRVAARAWVERRGAVGWRDVAERQGVVEWRDVGERQEASEAAGRLARPPSTLDLRFLAPVLVLAPPVRPAISTAGRPAALRSIAGEASARPPAAGGVARSIAI